MTYNISMGINVCVVEHDCRGSCCRGQFFDMSENGWQQYVLLVGQFGDFIRDVEPSEFMAMKSMLTPNAPTEIVHLPLSVEGTIHHLALVFGACPVLDQMTGYCMRYEERPPACESVKIGDKRCTVMRIRDGLPPTE